MPEFTFTLRIEAPIERVWEVVADIEGWPEMTPSVDSSRALDANVVATGNRFLLKQPKLRPTVWTVTEVRAGEYYSWESRAAGITTRADHLLVAEDGGVRLELLIRQDGLLAGPVARFTGAMTRRYMSYEANGIKRLSEQRAQGDGG
ncbi:SRPBCC family protein [Streptomyces odontomachi]|uniref:SRPBCC family protein n=1 Tax=Streptomyces odontomachi TaxID=2944940 RepID=UPI00210C211D|nr:SRPBCC family protein [Streptomyces sp. ODS25]